MSRANATPKFLAERSSLLRLRVVVHTTMMVLVRTPRKTRRARTMSNVPTVKKPFQGNKQLLTLFNASATQLSVKFVKRLFKRTESVNT